MTSADLTPIVYVVAGLSWLSAGILVSLSRGAAPVALTERAWASVALSLFVTVYAAIQTNADAGNAWWSVETGRIILRLATILLGTIPSLWLVRYWQRFR